VLCDGVPLLAGLRCVERPGEREAGARVAVFRPVAYVLREESERGIFDGRIVVVVVPITEKFSFSHGCTPLD